MLPQETTNIETTSKNPTKRNETNRNETKREDAPTSTTTLKSHTKEDTDKLQDNDPDTLSQANRRQPSDTKTIRTNCNVTYYQPTY